MTEHSILERGAGAAAFLSLAVAVTLAPLGACNRSAPGGAPGGGTAPEPKLVKLAFVTNNTSEFWKIAGAGIHKYEREGKVQVDIKLPSSGTAESQNQILQDLASQSYAAIAVSAIAPNDQIAVFDKIAEVIDKSNVADFNTKLAALKK